ncbi:hypothetical protein ACN47E_003111 [Coniothyrium glycines]
MAQRQICPSMGAWRRSLLVETRQTSKYSAKAFHSSSRKLEEPPSSQAPATPAPTTRKARSTNALRQITKLGQRRIVPGALAKGSFPSGNLARGSSPQAAAANEYGFLPEDAASAEQKGSPPRFSKILTGPSTNRGAPPPGQMVRAPAQLQRPQSTPNNATVGGARGPNLRGRDGKGARRPGGPGGRRGAGDPKRREKGSEGANTAQTTSFDEIDASDTLSDGMVHNLLRLQRKEWDRVPYEPKYAKGSFAANELIHAGRELFRGESAPVKIWGPLEKRIGVVGMFGAEATLKVRRELDGDAEPFGQEILEYEGAEEARDMADKTDAVRQPPQV